VRMWKVLVFAILDIASTSCQKKCLCPAEGPMCPAGVSIVLDDCGCCKVCARQLNEDCSKTEPCDRIKGLECNFGRQYGDTKGICRARSEGQTCEYNKRIYQNGEIFRPNCKHQCTCLDGAVGCVSLCPQPRLIKVPGQCCEQLVCPEEARRTKKYRRKQRLSEDDGEKSAMWTENLPGEFHCAVLSQHPQSCIRFQCTTYWSPCSRSCGTGVSTRMTISRETLCQTVTETRMCEVRRCDQMKLQKLKNGHKCKEIETSSRPVRMSFEGCRSVRRLQVQFCGSCSDGRCCRPDKTQTKPVLFRCKNGETVSRMVMMIQTCRCDFYCSDGHKMTSLYNAFNDRH
uniref:CCN family member 1 n=1 Tax=Neogobius melanostomus TaxID=47308 RepID=A0A8C6UJZ2_9GOBI